MDAFPILAAAALGGLILMAVVSAGAGKKSAGRGRSSGGRSSGPSLSREQMRDRWQQIIAVSKTGGSGLKSAVLDADKLFDQAMKQAGVRGETMGERLKNARRHFDDRTAYENVWRAHKLRNTMAHEIGFDLVPSQVREALADFERGLRELGVL